MTKVHLRAHLQSGHLAGKVQASVRLALLNSRKLSMAFPELPSAQQCFLVA